MESSGKKENEMMAKKNNGHKKWKEEKWRIFNMSANGNVSSIFNNIHSTKEQDESKIQKKKFVEKNRR